MMMSLGELIAQLDEEIRRAIRANNPEQLVNLHAARHTLVEIVERNGETEELHLKSLDSRG